MISGIISVMEREINDNDIKVDVQSGPSGEQEQKTSEASQVTIENGMKNANNKIVGKTERSKSLADATEVNQFGSFRHRISSIMSLNDLGGEVVVNRLGSTKTGIW